MKIIQLFAISILAISMIQCAEEGITSINFNSTNHPISTLGSQMRLSMDVPNKGVYSFSADTSNLNCSGDNCNIYLVPDEEMENLALILSDTKYFQWQFMTAVTPYPANECKFYLYGGVDQSGDYLDYMCTIGSGDSASKIIQELSKSFSGDARKALDGIVNSF